MPKKVKKVQKAPKKPQRKLKKAPKKVAKHRISKKTLKKDHYFYLVDGTPIHDINEMVKAFDTMSDEIFYHHANDMRNDFYNWIKDVYELEELAGHLLSCNTKEKHQIELLKYLLDEARK